MTNCYKGRLKMRNFRNLAWMLAATLSTKLLAYGTGYTVLPMEVSQKIISAEFSGITSNGGGIGLQSRYTQKATERLSFDAGLGIAGGNYPSRIFAAADYEIFPDYESQPRVSLKMNIENAKENTGHRNIVTFAPILSKGFNMWGHEAFPYLSIPYGISLNPTTQSYSTRASANIGINGPLPLENMEKKLNGSAEVIVGLTDNQYSGFFLSIGYPIE